MFLFLNIFYYELDFGNEIVGNINRDITFKSDFFLRRHFFVPIVLEGKKKHAWVEV